MKTLRNGWFCDYGTWGGNTDAPSTPPFFIVEPNQKQLIEIAKLVDAGALKAFVSAVVPLEEAAAAYKRTIPNKRGYGKVVITIAA
jgi:NADPH:quinone reductase-like Zn-dependent oxidoreductase